MLKYKGELQHCNINIYTINHIYYASIFASCCQRQLVIIILQMIQITINSSLTVAQQRSVFGFVY